MRIRDGQGHEVQKLSQQYVLSGEGKDLEAAKHGEILFYREAMLPPGVYTMETIVFDATAAQGSARVATLTVPEVDRTIGMSSLVLVNRIEEVKDAPTPDAGATPPLYVGQRLMYPNLGEPFQKSATAELPFYFTLYGDVQRRQGRGRAAAERTLGRRDSVAAAAGVRLAGSARRPAAHQLTSVGHLRAAHQGHCRRATKFPGPRTSR